MKNTLLVTGLLLLLQCASLRAAEVADVHFDESITLAGVEQPLLLNGLGIRYKFFFKIYIAALYVQDKSTSAEQLVAADGAKRMTMHFLYDEVEREKLVAGWNEGFRNNLTDAQLAALQPRIEQFNALFETMRAGEVINLDYIPEQGTRVIIRGQHRGTVPGPDFNRALLNIWLGEYPVGEDLKLRLLGG
jgi:hypothetical protein